MAKREWTNTLEGLYALDRENPRAACFRLCTLIRCLLRFPERLEALFVEVDLDRLSSLSVWVLQVGVLVAKGGLDPKVSCQIQERLDAQAKGAPLSPAPM